MIVKSGREPLIVPDLNKSDLTKDMNVTKAFGGGSLIGVPLIYEDGEKYGTLCGMDNKPYAFTDADVTHFQSLASILTYVLQLDKAKNRINELSVPIVPICEGVAILPIIGEINELRGERLIEDALYKSQTMDLDHLLIDLSGVSKINERMVQQMQRTAQALKLLGVTPIISGIRPDMAMKSVHSNLQLKDVRVYSTVQQSLDALGLRIVSED
ncbi:STAS domain-containing protein [Thalassobacillus hwangdonensis]|uniref:STAS domain-containing protein n=1 Tax=Thalassobacillus hwangdonensis TaxID=546108 RepID=A0ABW3L3U9_9BACI